MRFPMTKIKTMREKIFWLLLVNALIGPQANADLAKEIAQYQSALSQIKKAKNTLMSKISEYSAFKMHLGMTLSEILDAYPDAEFDLTSGGEDAYHRKWITNTKDVSEIKSIKFGPYQGAGLYGLEVNDPRTDRHIQLKFTYEGILSQVIAVEPFSKKIDCIAFEKKLSNRYGSGAVDDHKRPASSFSGSERSLYREWTKKIEDSSINGTGYDNSYHDTHFQLVGMVSNCIDNDTSIRFRLDSPYYFRLAEIELELLAKIYENQELLDSQNKGANPDF